MGIYDTLVYIPEVGFCKVGFVVRRFADIAQQKKCYFLRSMVYATNAFNELLDGESGNSLSKAMASS